MGGGVSRVGDGFEPPALLRMHSHHSAFTSVVERNSSHLRRMKDMVYSGAYMNGCGPMWKHFHEVLKNKESHKASLKYIWWAHQRARYSKIGEHLS